ncbi:MAG: DUF192 domain-containing protein [Alphaproteobacteria bacterium]|nr:DUF192 domain-containing protein [Alphaproteobacteria bacterium]
MRAARQSFLIGLSLLIGLSGCSAETAPAPASASSPGACLAQAAGEEPLVLLTATGAHCLSVEVADTPETRSRGLMWRRSLVPDRGMLFEFEAERPLSFWMKNTYIPLDIVFIAADGRVVHIARATVPHSLEPIPSGAPAAGVLEVSAGTADRLGLAPGDRVDHPFFAPAPAPSTDKAP